MIFMTEKYIRKQMYECAVCGKVFTTKDDFNEHYEKSHAGAEKYQGKVLVGDVKGLKVFAVWTHKDNAHDCNCFKMLIPGFRNVDSLSKLFSFGVLNYTYYDGVRLTDDEIKRDFTIMEPDVAQEELRSVIYDNFITDMKKNPPRYNDFKILFEGADRRKSDGN